MKQKKQSELTERELSEKLIAKKKQNEIDFFNYMIEGAKKFNCCIVPTLEIIIDGVPAELSICELLKDHKINIRIKSN